MACCNSWQYLVTILAKIFPRSWQDLAKILLRYPWRVDPGMRYSLDALVEKKTYLAKILQDNHENCKSCKILAEKEYLARILQDLCFSQPGRHSPSLEKTLSEKMVKM